MKNDYESRIIETVKRAMPSVVSIVAGKSYAALLKENPEMLMTPHGDHLDPPPLEETLPHTHDGKIRIGGGSGFVADPSGLILTNKHVVSDPHAEYYITTAAEESYPAAVLARDPLNDVAILKIDAEELAALPLGNSDTVELGQTVLAIGTALGEFQNTVSSGIISGLSRFITAFTDLHGHSERLHGLIQTDAAINPGNSGGPLVNLSGEVIGINSAVVFGAQNIGFAIPINKAKRDLLELKKFGRIKRPFLGIRYLFLNPLLQKKFQLPVGHGAFVLREEVSGRSAIVPGSAAAKAGIREGDIITELHGRMIDEKTSIEEILETIPIGEKFIAKIIRNGKENAISIIAEERPR